MPESRSSFALWGALAAVLLTSGLLVATMFTGGDRGLATTVLSAVGSAVLIIAGLLSGAIAMRRYMLGFLAAVSSRVKKELHLTEATQVQRHRALMAEVASVRSTAEELRREIEKVRSAIADVEAEYRKLHAFLKKEGSVQVVLDRFQASEKRLIASVEGGALTSAEILERWASESAESSQRAAGELREEFEGIRARLRQVRRDLRGINPQLSRLSTGVSGVHGDLDELRAATEQMDASIQDLSPHLLGHRDGLSQLSEEMENLGFAAKGLESSVVGSFPRWESRFDELNVLREDVSRLLSLTERVQSEVRNTVPELESRFENLSGVGEDVYTLRTLTEDLGSAVQGTVPALEHRFENLAGLGQELESLQGAVQRLEGEVANTAPQLNEKFDRVTSLGAEVNSLRSNTDDLKAAVDDIVPTMQSRFAGISGMLVALQDLRALTEHLDSTVRGSLPAVEAAVEDLVSRRDTGATMADPDHSAEADAAEQSVMLESGASNDLAPIEDAVKKILALTDTSKNEIKGLQRRIDRSGIEVVRQVEALLQLLGRVESPDRSFPASGGFAMNPDSLLLLSDLVRERKPQTILELGSGTSTVWVGKFAESIGAKVISVDHLQQYGDQTKKLVCDFDLDGTVEVRLADLVPVTVRDEERQWYDPRVLHDLEDIDMVIVDGPPESTGPEPRYPAFPLLRDVLSEDACIVVDDINREQESRMVESWIEDDPRLSMAKWAAGRTGVLEYRKEG